MTITQSTQAQGRLQAQNVTLGYDGRQVSEQLNLTVPDGRFSVIVGPNGCGKSTLLRSLGRLLKPQQGQVLLDGADMNRLPTKALARELGLLPQGAQAPDGLRVVDLVARGRYPHQQLLRQWSAQDHAAVAEAMRLTDVLELADREVDQLSGGQRQRVWIAMVLAQQTPLLLLDEPTTYLDLAHQLEVLDLLRELNRLNGHTLVAVLHDLNQACRYADHLIAMREGRIVAEGAPRELMTEQLVAEVFGLDCLIIDDPVSGTPMVIPRGRAG
ncbi:iron-dicitrate transporter ATP-binding subunit [Saccharospirillum sp. MSK14-1]|uniref:ABC transporter ATP-binding protein n=1 Tax=Saccharospirillum sp. MSK14-1 TaxID=1897632 RepID=UPI000D46DBE5|nr:ABC transporter ATP-binding protein [Saccharospirillum sp. MSK14-1]PTY38675.1 iron-dicitrate transporter ATP-binding subunit [Saccharospirillum sp. MSK14-1]